MISYVFITDECTGGIANCHSDATCVDITTGPGYHCVCNSGYYGDGQSSGTGCQGNTLIV